VAVIKLVSICGLALVLAFPATAPALTITNQPQSIAVNNASTAMFTIGASGVTSYQWKLNGSNLNDGSQNDGVIISGSTNSTLTLEDVGTNEAGTYTVLLNDSTNSSNAVLTITNGTIVRFIFTGFIGGGTSNVDVQLFDHDKPATVENFIHYITSGAFTNNMFFHRCEPGFALQGGLVGATDETNTNPPITGWDIGSYLASNHLTASFPPRVDSEFNVGPQIKNDFGTLAMALGENQYTGATDPDSASDSFFFNLADNSSILDSTNNGPFTVFGRILNNSNRLAFSNVLAYFNTLTNGIGIASNNVFSDYGVLSTNLFSTLPVNDVGTNEPANCNLVFCGFQFPNGTPSLGTNLPTVTVTSPPTNAFLTNGSSTQAGGTASNNMGLANVSCIFIPQAAPDGTYANGGVRATNYAAGTTNWSANIWGIETVYYYGLPYSEPGPLPPGSYAMITQSQDGAGNLSSTVSNFLTITGIVTNGNGTVSFATTTNTNVVNVLTNISPIGYPLQSESNYTVVATPANNWGFVRWTAYLSDGETVTATNQPLVFTASYVRLLAANFGPFAPVNVVTLGHGTVSVSNGQYVAAVGGTFQATATPGPDETFYGWNDGTAIYTNWTQSFTLTSNMTLTAEFVSNNAPRAISFTYPPAKATLATNRFLLKGKIKPAFKVAQITCQIFSTNTGFELGPLTTLATNIWSIAVSNLPPDEYEVEAVATYDDGVTSAVTEKFSVQAFGPVAGTYTGLFICDTGPSLTNSGSFTLTVGKTGAYTGRLFIPAYGWSTLLGAFNVYGNLAEGAYYLFKFKGNPTALYDLQLDVTNGTGTCTGTFAAAYGGWSSQLVCYKAATKLSHDTRPAPGKYILNLEPDSWTNTNGYACVSAGNGGVLAYSGALPDGATFSGSSRVGTNGIWHICGVPSGYGTKGMLIGWVTNGTSNGCNGQLDWVKATNVGKYLNEGINMAVNVTGTNYEAPAVSNYSIVFYPETNVVPITNLLSVKKAGGQFKLQNPGDNTNKLAITLSAGGALSGRFVPQDGGKALQFKGAFFGQSQGGSGVILETNGQLGTFLLNAEASP